MPILEFLLSQTRHGEVCCKGLNLFSQLLNVTPVGISLQMPVESSQLAILRCAVLQVNGNLDAPALRSSAPCIIQQCLLYSAARHKISEQLRHVDSISANLLYR